MQHGRAENDKKGHDKMEMFNLNAADWSVSEWRQSGCSRDGHTSGGL